MFGGSEDDPLDDSMSLAPSDAEELSGSMINPVPLPCAKPSEAKAGIDFESVEELGLKWSPPEEPFRSHLDEWFLPGPRQTPRQ